MKILLQRVTNASVVVANQTVGAIDTGLLLFVGIEKNDSPEITKRMVEKVLAYRVFADAQGKMNLSVQDISGGVLAISQFTLAADTQKGLRPSFSSAASPPYASELYDLFVQELRTRHHTVATGIFAANMQVSLTNDGPVTFLLEI